VNANRQRFWMLAGDGQWHREEDPATLRWDGARRVLRLAGRRSLPEPEDGIDVMGTAASRLELPRRALDPYGSRAFWDEVNGAVRSATPGLPGDVIVAQPLVVDAVTDLCMGSDGILYLAVDGKVALHDPRQRWETAPVSNGKITAWRLAPRQEGGAWVLDRDHERLGMVRGQPLPHRPPAEYDPSTWRPVSEESDPPRLAEMFDLGLEPGEVPVGIASSVGGGGRIALLL